MLKLNKICLVGLGSIGITHLEHIISNFKDIIVVDVDPLTIKKLEKFRGSKQLIHLSSLHELEFFSNIDSAVIANWGPDHFKTFLFLQKLGIKNYIIEKPITDSISELHRINQIRLENNLRIFINFQWSLSPLIGNISKIREKSKLGRIVGINVYGGCKCIATNGIHYLDLANLLFQANPIEVFSSYYDSGINPRNKDFLFLGGSATWKYSKDRYFNISFSNNSRISASMEIVFEHGIGKIIGDKLEILSIDKKKLDTFKSRTKTLYPSKTVYNGRAFTNLDDTDGLHLIYQKFIDKNFTKDNFEHSYRSTMDFFGSLISSDRNSAIKLPLKVYKLSKDFRRKWGIS
jgi:predicted dehydrogenase